MIAPDMCRQQVPTAVGADLLERFQHDRAAVAVQLIKKLIHAATLRGCAFGIGIDRSGPKQVVMTIDGTGSTLVRMCAVAGKGQEISHCIYRSLTLAAQFILFVSQLVSWCYSTYRMAVSLKQELRITARYFPLWTAVGLAAFSQTRVQRSFSHDSTPWSKDLETWMSGAWACALLMPFALAICHRFPIERKNWRPRLALHALCSLAFALVELAIHAAVLRPLGLYPPFTNSYVGTFLMLVSTAFQQSAMAYWGIVAVSHGFRLYRQYQEREKQALRLELNSSELRAQLARAQLSALKSQLQPHFLFNTLNAIMVLVRQQKVEDAEQTLARLSDLLRYVLDDSDAQEAPLGRELDYLRLYLSIEEVRFRDRLRVEVAVDASLLDAAVPHMGLQPLVENAIRHGIGRRSTAGTIRVTAARAGDSLVIQVCDDGPGVTPSAAARPGAIGLANTRARLAQLYGERASLTLANRPEGGAVATVRLPYRTLDWQGALEMVEAHEADRATG